MIKNKENKMNKYIKMTDQEQTDLYVKPILVNLKQNNPSKVNYIYIINQLFS